MTRVIIADLMSNNNKGLCTGHYFSLASNYKEIFQPYAKVKIAGGPIYEKKFSKDDLLTLPYDSLAKSKKILNLFRMVLNARSLSRQVCNDDVVIIQQSLPTMILLAMTLFGFKNAKVYQIQYSAEPMRHTLFRGLLCLNRKKIKGIICPNDVVGNAYGMPYIAIPDYIYVEKKENKQQHSFFEKKYDFASIGRIEKDKGVAESVSVLKNKTFSLLVAGVPREENEELRIKEYSKSAPNITTNLNYVSEKQYNDYLEDCRFCLLNYQGSYADRSSGVVLDTLFRGVPVVGRRCRALQFIEDLGMGVLYDDIKNFDFGSVMHEDKYKRFLESIESFKKSFSLHIEKLLCFTCVK